MVDVVPPVYAAVAYTSTKMEMPKARAMFVMFETCSAQAPGATPANPALLPDTDALLEALQPAQHAEKS